MNPLRTLVVFYSQDSRTRDLAIDIAFDLDADIMEIFDETPREGILGRIRSFLEVVFDIPAPTRPFDKEPYLYDLVLIGTSVWNNSVCSPIRTFLRKSWARLPNVGFFMTHRGKGIDAAMEQLHRMSHRNPLGALAIHLDRIGQDDYLEVLVEFEDKVTMRADMLNAMNQGLNATIW